MRKINQKSGLSLVGRWRITALYKGTKKVYRILEGENIIATVGKELVGKMLIDLSGYDTGLTYCGIGTDDTTPVVGNTTINSEVFRKAITSKTQSSSPTNEFVFSTFFSAGESTYNIKEVGIFGHSTATSTIDTGILFSHYLEAFDNSAGSYDLIFDYVLTIG